MIIQTSKVATRAMAAKLSKATGIDTDTAMARVLAGTGTPETAGWVDRPRRENWRSLCHPDTFAELLSDQNPQPGYDLSAYLANRSAQAYLSEAELIAAIQADGGVALKRLARWTDVACVYRRGTTAVIVFRGTILWNPIQWLHSNLLAVPIGLPARHLGFRLAWRRLRGDVQAWLDENLPPNGELLIAGHSLGGAIALLAAFELADRYTIRGVVTIGSPRVGLGGFQDDYLSKPCRRDGEKTLAKLGDVTRRLTHEDDLISRIPPPPFFRYIGEAYRLDGGGNLTLGESRSTFSRVFRGFDDAVGWGYRTIEESLKPKPPKPLSFLMVKDARTGGLVPRKPAKTPVLPSHAAKINEALLVLKDPPKKGLARLIDDLLNAQRFFPPLAYVTGYVVQFILLIVGVVLAVGVFVLGAFDLRAHQSGLYVAAFQARYRSQAARSASGLASAAILEYSNG